MSEAPSPEWAELTALEHSRINPYQTWCHDICFGAGVWVRNCEPHRGARDLEVAFWSIPLLNLSSGPLLHMTFVDNQQLNTLRQRTALSEAVAEPNLNLVIKWYCELYLWLPVAVIFITCLCSFWVPTSSGRTFGFPVGIVKTSWLMQYDSLRILALLHFIRLCEKQLILGGRN